MSRIKPVVKDATRDPEGQKRQEFARSVDFELKSGRAYHVVADGYENAVYLNSQYLVYEVYKGTDGHNYDHYRPANAFETHLLCKIEGLNNFFVEQYPF